LSIWFIGGIPNFLNILYFKVDRLFARSILNYILFYPWLTLIVTGDVLISAGYAGIESIDGVEVAVKIT
jgi:hypothetical protein